MPELLAVEFAFNALIVSECTMIDAFEKRCWVSKHAGAK